MLSQCSMNLYTQELLFEYHGSLLLQLDKWDCLNFEEVAAKKNSLTLGVSLNKMRIQEVFFPNQIVALHSLLVGTLL